MAEKKVKIVKDTVSHRIPIGSIVRIKSDAEPKRGKKCYNILDYCCYVSEDDVEFLSPDQLESQQSILINDPYQKKSKTGEPEMNDWFDKYSERIDSGKTKFKRGDKVYAKNVISLAPNGMAEKTKDGVYIITQVTNEKYWMTSGVSNDLNEYYCRLDDASSLKSKR